MSLVIHRLEPGSPLIPILAAWRHRAFFEAEGYTPDQSVAQLDGLVRLSAETPDTYQVALVAELDGEAVGTCLLIDREPVTRHPDLTPFLAGLFVVETARRRGVGAALVRAAEDQARSHGFARLYLYTDTARAFYERLGWRLLEAFDWEGDPFSLMVRELGGG